MRFMHFAAAALVACGARGAAAQDRALFPAPEPPEVVESERVEAPPVATPNDNLSESDRMLQGSGVPSSPYPAGLSYMMTPQPFRVPYPNRIYYPIPHYVRKCPYFSKGFYWGADWNRHLLGCNPWLIHGDKRFNPYLTEAKIAHQTGQSHHHHNSPHAGHAPGECEHCAPALAEKKSSRRVSSKTIEIVSDSPQSTDEETTDESELAESTAPESSQVKFTEPTEDDESPTRSAAPAKKPKTHVAGKASQRSTNWKPSWQRPPAVKR